MTQYYDREVETMPSAEREKLLNQRLEEVTSYAYNNVPVVRERFDQAGVKPSQIRKVKDLERIPVLAKSELLKMQRANPPFGGLLTIAPQELKRIFISPGPLYDPQSRARGGMLTVSISAKVFYAAGFGGDDIILSAFSYHLVPAGLLADDALVLLGATVIPTGVGNTDLQVQIMRELKVTGYFGTPSFLMTLINRAEEQGYNFRRDFTLRRAVVGAEMLPPSLRKKLEEDYGIDVRQVYGTADLGLFAYECSEKSGMHLVEELIVEIVDLATGKQVGPGEVGEVVVTCLDPSYPLFRFGSGDLSAYTDEPCPCGRTSPRLTRIMGRVGDAAKVRGMFIRPEQIKEVMAKFPEVSRFQMVVTRSGARDEMALKVEPKESDIDREELVKRLGESIREVCRLKLDRVEFMAEGAIADEHKIIVDERRWE